MPAIQPGGLFDGEEELAAVGVGPSVGHGEPALAVVLQLEVLVLELGAVDGLAARARVSSEVAALDHEVGNDPVEGGAPVALVPGPFGEGLEVLDGLWDGLAEEADLDGANVAVTVIDLERDNVSDERTLNIIKAL